MKTSRQLSKLTSLFALSGALALGGLTGGCVATRTSDSTDQYVDDTVKGVVQLSGFVNTSDQKSAAGKDASAIPGVKSVKNDLIVK